MTLNLCLKNRKCVCHINSLLYIKRVAFDKMRIYRQMLEQYQMMCGDLRDRRAELNRKLKNPSLSRKEWQALESRRRLLCEEIAEGEWICRQLSVYAQRETEFDEQEVSFCGLVHSVP